MGSCPPYILYSPSPPRRPHHRKEKEKPIKPGNVVDREIKSRGLMRENNVIPRNRAKIFHDAFVFRDAKETGSERESQHGGGSLQV